MGRGPYRGSASAASGSAIENPTTSPTLAGPRVARPATSRSCPARVSHAARHRISRGVTTGSSACGVRMEVADAQHCHGPQPRKTALPLPPRQRRWHVALRSKVEPPAHHAHLRSPNAPVITPVRPPFGSPECSSAPARSRSRSSAGRPRSSLKSAFGAGCSSRSTSERSRSSICSSRSSAEGSRSSVCSPRSTRKGSIPAVDDSFSALESPSRVFDTARSRVCRVLARINDSDAAWRR